MSDGTPWRQPAAAPFPSKPVTVPQKPWRQLAFIIGEAGLTLLSNGVLFIVVSRVAGPEVLGTYALALAWLTLFQGFSSFGIPDFLMREVGAHGRAAAAQVAHAMLLGLLTGLLAIGVMLPASRLLGYTPDLVAVIDVAAIALIPAFLIIACRAVFLALRQMHLTFVALLVEVGIVMSASLYLLLEGYHVIALMAALVAAKIIAACVALALLYGRVLPARPGLDARFLARTARTVFTFGVGNMLGMITMRINTIMASMWVDIAAIGQFAAATKIMEIGLIAPNLFAQLLMTRIAHSFSSDGKRDPNRFGPWYSLLFALVIPTCIGVWVFAGVILDALFGAGFGNALWVLRILMIYSVIESADAVMSVILKAAHRQREDVTRLAFNPLTNIAVNLILLPGFGTIGAAIGRVAGGAASAILRDRVIARRLHAVNWLRFALKPTLISLGVGLLCHALIDQLRPAWLVLLYLVGTASLLRATGCVSLSAVKEMMSFPSGRDR